MILRGDLIVWLAQAIRPATDLLRLLVQRFRVGRRPLEALDWIRTDEPRASETCEERC